MSSEPKILANDRIDATQALDEGVNAHQAGDLAQAERCYGLVLRIAPDDFDARHLLGVVKFQQGRNEEALTDIAAALAINPGAAAAYSNLAAVQHKLGRFADALASYDKVLTIDPRNAEAFLNRGVALRALKRIDEAVASYDRALAIKSDYAEAYNSRGAALADLGRLDEAIASYDRSIAINQNSSEAHYNRGLALADLLRHAEALASFERAVGLKPDDGRAHFARADALASLNRPDEALAAYDKTLSLDPEHVQALINRSYVLHDLKRPDEAVASCARALAIKPDLPFLQGVLMHLKMRICDWKDFEAERANLVDAISRGRTVAPPFPVLALSSSLALHRKAAEIWTQSRHPPMTALPAIDKRRKHERIKVGYFSADFHSHATAYLMAELFEKHDRSRFETIAFSFGNQAEDAMRGRLRAAFDKFVDARGSSDRRTAELARGMELDIAVDLKGFTRDSRPSVFAHRAAPIQVNYLGYPATMGADYIDYIIADCTVIPPEDQRHYAEKVVYLPDCYQVNDSRRRIAATKLIRKDAGLPESGFVFCCFNQSYKISPDTFDSWMRILRAVEGAMLWLFADSEAAASNLRREAASRGVEASRLVFAGPLPLAEHLARHRLADLFLDTHPYNAHTTASDALWSGLPVLTRSGESFAGRVAASLLNSIGLPELVAATREDYEALAIELARDPAKLRLLRRKLADNRRAAPLFDSDLFARNLEAAYTAMFDRYLADLPPAPIVAPAVRGVDAEGAQASFESRFALHQKGDNVGAERHYKEALRYEPAHFDALHMLGVVHLQRGRASEALDCMESALRVDGRSAAALANLAIAQRKLLRFEEALASYDAALAITPDHAEWHCERGVVLRTLRRFPDALASFDQALAIRPDYAEAMNGRGNALRDVGRLDEAVTSYEQALVLKPNDPTTHFNLGISLAECGRRADALASYDKALAGQPNYVEAMVNRGVILLDLGRPVEAMADFDQALAIRPDSADALVGRGGAHAALRTPDEAIGDYGRALTIKPDLVEALNNRGAILAGLRRPKDAIADYDRAIAIKPTFAEAHNNRGAALADLGHFAQALESYDKALALKPSYAEAHNNRGIALRNLKSPQEALASFDQALAISPSYADAYSNRGNAILDLRRPADAIAEYDKALAGYNEEVGVWREHADAHYNRGVALADLKRPEEAIASYETALSAYEKAMKNADRPASMRRRYADAIFNRSIAALLMGDFATGWPGYEARHDRSKGERPMFVGNFPVWSGQELAGKRIVVSEEQGMGDILQFSRYLPLLAERGGEVTFLVRRSLHRLLQPLSGAARIARDAPPDEIFDFQIALLSLPGAFGTRLDTIPAAIPYLFAEAPNVAKWRERIGSRGLKVGIAWQGNPNSAVDIGRSIPLRCFAPLAAIPGVRLVSLQKNAGVDQLAQLDPAFPVETFADDFDNGPDAFVDTAAIMASLDLIVTSDTAIAHLAGALRRPTWVALKHAPDWRWLLDRSDSPWYPSMRLYRQKVADDWDEVFARVASDLADFSRETGRGATQVEAPCSIGEVFDKLTILDIKAARIADADKLRHVARERHLLREIAARYLAAEPDIVGLVGDLRSVNETLWDVEDALRACEQRGDFGADFIALARSVYKINDRRAALKADINRRTASDIVEVKSYGASA